MAGPSPSSEPDQLLSERQAGWRSRGAVGGDRYRRGARQIGEPASRCAVLPLSGVRQAHGTIASPDRFNAQYPPHIPLAARIRCPTPVGSRTTSRPVARAVPAPTSASLDYQVGRLLDRLDRLGLRESTLRALTSDNGRCTRDWRHWYRDQICTAASATCARREICTKGASVSRRWFGGPVGFPGRSHVEVERCTATMSCRRLRQS